MYQLSANIELLFTEAGPDAASRVRAAAAAGFDAVEMWFSAEKDVPALAAALRESGVRLTSFVAGPRTNFTLPGTDLTAFWAGLDEGVEHAAALSCPRIVLGSGVGFPGMPRPAQHARLIEVFSEVIERTKGADVTFVLEPVNTRVDHPGALCDRTGDAVAVARGVIEATGTDRFGILYDLYHSITQGEDVAAELANADGVVRYVQLADVPGRAEPGSGAVDWAAQLATLRASGYDGPIGLEFTPTVESSAAVARIRELAASA